MGLRALLDWIEPLVHKGSRFEKLYPLMFQGKDAWHIHYAFDLMMKPYLGGPEFLKSLLAHTYDFRSKGFVSALERFYTLKKYFPKDFMG